MPRKLISDRALKARIFRALAKSAFVDLHSGAEYLYDDILESDEYEKESRDRERQVGAIVEEIAFELIRRADKLERADRKAIEHRKIMRENAKGNMKSDGKNGVK